MSIYSGKLILTGAICKETWLDGWYDVQLSYFTTIYNFGRPNINDVHLQ